MPKIMSGNQPEEEELESAQKHQKNVGNAAASNPETNGPTENLRDKAAKMKDEDEDSEEPA
jgi:hypothetical protein